MLEKKWLIEKLLQPERQRIVSCRFEMIKFASKHWTKDSNVIVTETKGQTECGVIRLSGHAIISMNQDQKSKCLTLEKNCVNIKNVEKFQKKKNGELLTRVVKWMVKFQNSERIHHNRTTNR